MAVGAIDLFLQARQVLENEGIGALHVADLDDHRLQHRFDVNGAGDRPQHLGHGRFGRILVPRRGGRVVPQQHQLAVALLARPIGHVGRGLGNQEIEVRPLFQRVREEGRLLAAADGLAGQGQVGEDVHLGCVGAAREVTSLLAGQAALLGGLLGRPHGTVHGLELGGGGLVDFFAVHGALQCQGRTSTAPSVIVPAGVYNGPMSDDDVRVALLAAIARQAKGSQPTGKWLRSWRDAIAPFHAEEVRAWCRMQWERATHQPVEEAVLLAAFWGMAAVAAQGTPTMLADWAWRLGKAGQHKLANAAIQAIGMIAAGEGDPGTVAPPDDPDGSNDPTVTEEVESEPPPIADEAIGQLQRLKARVRHRATLRRIDQALSAVAAVRGLSSEALQDLVVEDADLAQDGSRSWPAGPYDLYLFLTDDGDVELAVFERDSGRAMGAPPKVVRNEHFGVLNEAKAVQKVLSDTLSTQKHRLEQALESQRAWSWTSWRQVFGRHPLMRHLAMRLVWTVYLEGKLIDTACFNGEELVDAGNDHVRVPPKGELRLLHPALVDPGTLRAWQGQVVARRLIQPFKQVFREVYYPLPGEAERRRSERFAGMVVRHRQMYALLRGRGWSGLAGIGPTGYMGLKELPGAGLTAVVGFRQFRHYQDRQRRQVTLGGVEFLPSPLKDTPSGVDSRVPLASIGAVAYSEVMRDIALVVGVAGLGEESALRDGELSGRHVPIGLLGGQVEMRASLVRELLPLLGLGDHVRLEGADALVTFAGHTFRLHLANGEVTLDEDGRKLDLEGIERSEAPLYMPFEGGDTATAAILSTLMWLAKFGQSRWQPNMPD
nr:hypothetical protein [uncultured bacterium]